MSESHLLDGVPLLRVCLLLREIVQAVLDITAIL
jgi:hypothetical protein